MAKVNIKFTGIGEPQTDGTMRVVGVFEQTPAALEPPSAPINLRVVAQNGVSVGLEWDMPVDSPAATNFEVYRDDVLLDETGSATEALTDDTVSAPATYVYKVRAENADGFSVFSDSITVNVVAAPEVPGQPVLSLVRRTSFLIEFEWAPVPLALEYKVYDGAVLLDTITGTTFELNGLSEEEGHTFTVIATNAAGDGPTSAPLVISTLPNQPPIWDAVPLQTADVGSEVNLVLGDYVTDPEAEQGGPIAPITFSSVTLPPGLQISSNGLSVVGSPTTAGNYSSTVTASDGDETANVTIDWAISATADTTPPTPPSNVQATANGSTVTVTWDPSTDTESGVRRYRVIFNGSFLSMASGSPYIHENVPNGSHIYTLRAEDNANLPANGNISVLSNEAPVTVNVGDPLPDVPINFVATVVSASRIDLSWSPGPSGATPTDYDVDFSTTSASGPWTALPVTGTGTTFSHTGLTAIQHWYRLRANTATQSSGFTTATATPSGGTQTPDFIVGATVDVIDCRALRDVSGVVRKVQPGEVIQINERTADSDTPSTIFEIQYPEGTAANPIRVVPEPNKQVVFQRWNPSGGFAIVVLGPRGTNVPASERNKYGYITIDGFTTSSSVPANAFDGKKHGFVFRPSVNNPQGDNPTNVFRARGFISGLTLRYFWFDGRGGNPKMGGVTKNESDFKRADYPGVFRGSSTLDNILCMNVGSAYMGQNFGPGYLPSRDTTIRYSMFLNCGQTPILVKNNWEGFTSVHHNIVKHSGDDPGPVIQRNSISITASAGEVHHNWLEDTGQGVIGNSENKVQAMRCDCNDGPYVAPFQGYPGYSSIELKVYSNIIFRAVEGGIVFSSNNSRTSDPIAKYLAKCFSNTIDNIRNPSGGLEDAIDFASVASGSFCRNNIATRSAGFKGIPSADVSRNYTDTGVSVFTNVYSYSTYADYESATESEKNYKLSGAVPAYGGSTLGVDLAATDFSSAYDGNVPTESASEANDTTRSGGSYDMGALERA